MIRHHRQIAPVIREAGGDRCAVTGGTTVLSDWIKVRITAAPGSTFLDRMIGLVEGAERQKTPNEMALSVLLAGLTLIFLIAVVTLRASRPMPAARSPCVILVALLVTLIPTTIGGLLSAIGIAGMDRLVRFNVLATSGRAVEAAGDVDTLLLDKTGTITFGNRMASEFIALPGVAAGALAEAALPRARATTRRKAGPSSDWPRTNMASRFGISADSSENHPFHRPDPNVRRRCRTRAQSARARSIPCFHFIGMNADAAPPEFRAGSRAHRP